MPKGNTLGQMVLGVVGSEVSAAAMHLVPITPKENAMKKQRIAFSFGIIGCFAKTEPVMPKENV